MIDRKLMIRQTYKVFCVSLMVGLSKCNVLKLTCHSNTNRDILLINDTTLPGHTVAEFDDGILLTGTCNDGILAPINNTIVLNKTLRGENCGQAATTTSCDLACKDANGTVSRSIIFIFTIQHLDINEPSFPHPVFYSNVSEKAAAGTIVFLFNVTGREATDADCWNSLNYNLEANSPAEFKMENAAAGRLVTTGETLIYDNRNTYNVTIIATFKMPGDTSESTTSTVLTINVLDVDDKPPAFSNLSYVLNIPEESISSSLVTSPPILCQDLDYGINTTVVYNFTEMNSYFHIQYDSGQLLQQASFDREQLTEWQTNIICYQEDDISKTDTAILHIKVNDVNDNAAEFESTSLKVSITENSVEGTYVATVTATDKDMGENAVIIYLIDQQYDTFRIDNTSGVVRVNNPEHLDREMVSNLTLVIYAVDLQGNHSDNNVSIVIEVTDANDNSPQFTVNVYRFYFNTSAQGYVIGAVKAVDEDVPASPNANVTYTIEQGLQDMTSSNSQFPLFVDRHTGNIFINGTVMPGFACVMIIQGCDSPTNVALRRCDFARVIAVYTLNTTFSTVSVSMEINENSNIGTIIDILPIRGDHYVVSSNDFVVEPENHMLKTNIELDREMVDLYNITINVFSDTLGPVGDVNISITVTDMNDHPPVFDQDAYYFMLPEGQTVSSVIGTVNSTDDDIGHNSARVYRFQQSAFLDVFNIDLESGTIMMYGIESSRLRTFYQLSVTVSDQGIPSLQTSTNVYISEMAVDHDSVTIKLGTMASPSVVNSNKTHLESEIATLINVEIIEIKQVEAVQVAHKNIRSYIHVAGFDANDTAMPVQVMQRLLAENWTPIQDLFRDPIQYINTAQTSNERLNTAEIALIVMAIVILIGGIIAIVVVFKQWNKHTKNQRLYESLRRPSTLYDSQEIRVDFGDENGFAGHHKNREFRRHRSREPEALEGSFGLGYINTGYTADDDDHAPKTPTWNANDTPRIPRWSTSDSLKDAIESLEELTNRLNAEDNISRITSLSRERKSMRSYNSSNGATPLVDDLQEKHKELQDTDDYITPIVDYPLNTDGEIDGDIRDNEADIARETGPTDQTDKTDTSGIFYVNSFKKQCRDKSETDDSSVILEATAF